LATTPKRPPEVSQGTPPFSPTIMLS